MVLSHYGQLSVERLRPWSLGCPGQMVWLQVITVAHVGTRDVTQTWNPNFCGFKTTKTHNSVGSLDFGTGAISTDVQKTHDRQSGFVFFEIRSCHGRPVSWIWIDWWRLMASLGHVPWKCLPHSSAGVLQIVTPRISGKRCLQECEWSLTIIDHD